MIQPETWKAIGDYSTKVWSFIGPLVGVLVGAYIANRSHRKQWRVDNKKAEYRELLTAINGSFMKIIALSSHQPFFQDAQRDRDLLIAETDAASAAANSILIADEVSKLRVMERWTGAARNFAEKKDVRVFLDEVTRLSDEIRKSALKEIAKL